MKGKGILVFVAGLVALVVSSAVRAEEAKVPEEPADEIMGEYAGKCRVGDAKGDAEAKVIAEGDGNYRAVLLPKAGGGDAKEMRIELKRIQREVRTTFVFVTHDQEEALSMATRIAVMSGGHVVQVGTPSQIYHRPVDRFVADFIGESNFLEGRVDGGSFVLPDRTRLAIRPGAAPGAATLMVRPEVLEVTGPQEGRAGCLLPGRVVGMSFMGNHTRITLETAAGALVVHRAHPSGAFYDERSPGIGEEACVWWATEQSTILTSTSGGEN